ncbi:MAG: hypothetical protein M1830_010780 [Pleopsidium flavum]|nr:MAG: hypothetical protein M1830_010780 [Pleopsidium flavum]
MDPHPYWTHDGKLRDSQVPQPLGEGCTSIDGVDLDSDYEMIPMSPENVAEGRGRIHHINAIVALPSPPALTAPLIQVSEDLGLVLRPADIGTDGNCVQDSNTALDAVQSKNIDEEALRSSASSNQIITSTMAPRNSQSPIKSHHLSKPACQFGPTLSTTTCGHQMVFSRTPSPKTTDEPSERSTDEAESNTSLEDSCEIGPLYADDPDEEASDSDCRVSPRFTNFVRRKRVSKQQVDGDSAQVSSRAAKKRRAKPRVHFADENASSSEEYVVADES